MKSNHLLLEFIFLFLTSFFIVIYLVAAIRLKNKVWPKLRTFLWVAGMLCIFVSAIGPIANLGHHLFVFHMIQHLLLGMLAPLLITLSRPITLLLITLKTQQARRITQILRSPPLRLLTNPIYTLLLNIGGLWILYSPTVFNLIHKSIFLFIFVHIHLFLAGYIFTSSIIAIEPFSHKYSYLFRSLTMIIAIAGHDILAKLLFAYPFDNFAFSDVQTGAVLMYYGGDFVDLLIITILCYNWYNVTSSNTSKAFI